MPRINAKGMAEMIALPGYAQIPILAAQKYPSQGPAQFRRPYYAPAIDAIRNAYQSNDRGATVRDAREAIRGLKVASRRENLNRVLESFGNSDQLQRQLTIARKPRIIANLGTVELRASPDIVAIDEAGATKLLYYHCKSTAYDQEAAKRLIEISHWLCEENEIDIAPRDIEVIDLSNGTLHRIRNRRESTVRQMKQTAKVIASLWDDL